MTTPSETSTKTPRYFTGEPCKHGHVSERYVHSRKCVECLLAAARKRRAKRPDPRPRKEIGDAAAVKAWVMEVLHYEPDTGQFTWKVESRRRSIKAGYPNSHGYIFIRVRGRDYAAHRLAWLLVHGDWPPDQVDHINGSHTRDASATADRPSSAVTHNP